MKQDSFIVLLLAIFLIWLGASQKGRELIAVLRGQGAGMVEPSGGYYDNPTGSGGRTVPSQTPGGGGGGGGGAR